MPGSRCHSAPGTMTSSTSRVTAGNTTTISVPAMAQKSCAEAMRG